MDIDIIKEYANLETRRQQLEGELKDIKVRIGELQPVLVKDFIDNEIDHTRINGRTIFLQRQLWAKYEDKLAAIKALKDAGYADYVKEGFMPSQVSALLRELDANGEDLPPEFDGVIGINETFKIKSRSK